jgi:hypothetical protein
LKRQQAVEDAIALRLASNETGKALESLPPGKIFGMKITEAKTEIQLQSSHSDIQSSSFSDDVNKKSSSSSLSLATNESVTSSTPVVSQNAIEMLSSLFPHRKRSVLELVLRRCDLDLLR